MGIGADLLQRSEAKSLRIHQKLGDHHRCTLAFDRDPSSAATTLQLQDLAGSSVVVVATDDTGPHTLFEGAIVDASEEHMPQGTCFTVEAHSASTHLGAYRRTRLFPESTLADVAKSLGAKVEGEIAGEAMDYVQQGESDFDFLLRLADEHGLLLRPASESVELRKGFAEESCDLYWGENLLEFAFRLRPTNGGIKGGRYQQSEKRDHRFHGIRKFPETLSGGAPLVSALKRSAPTLHGGGDPELLEGSDRAPTLGTFRAALERESERALGTAVWVEGSSTHPGLKIGERIHVQGGMNWSLSLTGDFGLVEVVHTFDGEQYRNSFTASPWSAYTNEKRPERKRQRGVVSALVVEADDPEQKGRVRVRYAWQDEGERTPWVRVIVPYAGGKRGIAFLPEIGDEVIVVFEEGDPERPYILGSVWTGKDEGLQEKEVKQIVTASGNTLRMVDTQGKETIEIYSAEGKALLDLSNDAGGKPRITLHSEGDLALKAKGEIRFVCKELIQQIKGGSKTEIGGGASLKVGQSLAVDAGMNAIVKAGANASLQAGAVVETVGGAMNAVGGGMVHVQPSGHQAQKVQIPAIAALSSVWGSKDVPASVAPRTSGDRPTPRAAEKVKKENQPEPEEKALRVTVSSSDSGVLGRSP